MPSWILLIAALLWTAVAHADPVEPAEEPPIEVPTEPSPPTDAFVDWRHHTLDNGMRLWIKPWPEATVVRVTAVLPVGAREDPEDKEGLAHYLEHVLFTSIPGKTEAEFKNEVADRGGVRNGSTNHHRTEYHVEIPPEHTDFALGWIHELLFNKVYDDANIENQRKPILLEGGENMKQPNAFTLLGEWLTWDWVALPRYIEREFGIEHDDDATLGTWTSLHAIEPADVVGFYETHYGPQNLLITVIGDVDADAVLAEAQSLYGGHEPWGKKATWVQKATDPQRARKRYGWSDRGDAEYSFDVKVFDPEPHDRLVLELIANMADIQLDEELRWGEEKAVYGISVYVSNYRGHDALKFSAGCAPDQLERVQSEVARILDLLSSGEDPERFVYLRDRALDRIRARTLTPDDVASRWIERSPYFSPERFETFPDVIRTGEALTAASLSEWMQAKLRDDATIEVLERPSPMSDAWLPVLIFGVIWGLLLVARPLVAANVDLTRLRYVRKVRFTAVQWFVGMIGLPVIWFLIAQFIHAADARIADQVARIPIYALEWTQNLLTSALYMGTFLLLMSLIPRKLLLFEHEWRLKFWSWRSWGWSYDAIQELERTSLIRLWMRGRFLTIPLWFGPFKSGLYVRIGKHLGLFVHTRDNDELKSQFERFKG